MRLKSIRQNARSRIEPDTTHYARNSPISRNLFGVAQGSHLLRMNEARTVRIGSGEESRSQAGKYWINNNFNIYNKKHYSLIKLNFWKNCYYRICHYPRGYDSEADPQRL